MACQDPARVLDAEVALDRRLEQVAERRGERDRGAERERLEIVRKPWSYIAKNATAIAASVPPTKPSHDFPGEIVGAILWRPIVRPTKYAAVSSAKTAIRP